MNIRITAGQIELLGTLEDNPTARDFAALLPVTLTLSDFAGTEKISDLPRRLDTADAPAAHTGRPGDITYYAPWGNLALFYGQGPDANGLVLLGRIRPTDVQALSGLSGDVTLTAQSPLDSRSDTPGS